MRHDDINSEVHEFRSELSSTIGPAFCPSILDRYVAAINPAEFGQSSDKSFGPLIDGGACACAQKPNGWQLASLLRVCRYRPGRRTTKSYDKLAPLHSITSSAVESNDCGTV